MKTPICDFVQKYVRGDTVRAHMPGHKGKGHLGCECYDITEIHGADVLYHSEGIIRESENNASRLFSTARTLYSCEGSSLSIRAMLYLCLVYAQSMGKSTLVLAQRNAHKAFLCGTAVLGMDVEWMYGEDGGSGIVSCSITADSVARHIDSLDTAPCAVYITSPDYLGNIADVEGIARVCRDRGVLLLVDNAHGAYLNFLPMKRHPISLGADICCDSAHKTLPVLTGGGYLHISRDAPEIVKRSADSAMELFSSTSPSYLILQSLDMANAYIADGYPQRLAECMTRTELLRRRLCRCGYELVGDEMLKLTIKASSYGYTGYQLSQFLRDGGVECEFADPDYTVLMISVDNTSDELDRIGSVLCSLPRKQKLTQSPPPMPRGRRVMSPRTAMFSAWREVAVCDAVGRVLAQPSVSCPPAIPVLVCGEMIDENAVRAFEYYGIERCRVVENVPD